MPSFIYLRACTQTTSHLSQGEFWQSCGVLAPGFHWIPGNSTGSPAGLPCQSCPFWQGLLPKKNRKMTRTPVESRWSPGSPPGVHREHVGECKELKPFSINGPDLEDWLETTNTPRAPNDAAGLFSMAMHIVEEEEAAKSSKIDTAQPEQVAYRQRATKDLTPYRTEDGPKRDFKRLGIIEGYMHINGHKAHVLLDGGSTLDMISANFAAVHKLDMFQLKKPIKLQMATSGSHSVINYGARAELHIGELKEQCYFDVVNLDRYHAILGMPFLHEFDIMLNYAGYGSFKLKDRWFCRESGCAG
jgi:hypothetical protein